MNCLHNACEEGNLELVKKLMNDKRLNIFNERDKYGFTSFHFACRK